MKERLIVNHITMNCFVQNVLIVVNQSQINASTQETKNIIQTISLALSYVYFHLSLLLFINYICLFFKIVWKEFGWSTL